MKSIRQRQLQQRILSTALNESVVRREGAVNNMVRHWKGGDHTALPRLPIRMMCAPATSIARAPGSKATIGV
jgi:hypothetical protein